MPTIIKFPDGKTALLRDGDELSNRQVKEIRRAARKVGVVGQKLRDAGLEEVRETIANDDADEDAKNEANAKAAAILSGLTDEEDENLDLFQRTAAIVRLISWDLDLPLPTTVEEVDDLPRPIYTVLTTEAAKLDLNEAFDMDSGVTDPKADTEGSDSSSPPSEEVSS
jgi:hypothetical protein